MGLRAADAAKSLAATAPEPFTGGGYALLPSFLDAVDVAQAIQIVAALHTKPADPSCVRANNSLLPLRWCDAAVDLVLSSPRRIARLAEVLEADDLRWISGYVSSKEPRSGPLAWHQDWWCWDHPVSFSRRAPQVAMLCYLSATDTETGALRVLPGSHLRGGAVHVRLPEAHGDDAEVDAVAFADLPEQVTLRLSAGDAVVLDYRLLHGTHANAATTRRDALLLTFAPSWSGLPEDVRAHLISHPAQPLERERVAAMWATRLLPRYDGPRRDLPVNRVPPPRYELR